MHRNNNKKKKQRNHGRKRKERKKQQQQRRKESRHQLQARSEFDPKREFKFLWELEEKTPASLDAMLELPIFIDVFLKPSEMPRWVEPTPLVTARRGHSGHNVSTILHMQKDEYYEPVFGFVVFVDLKSKFIRGNAHVWVRHKETDEWLDPSPLVDENEPSGDQMLVASDHLFTQEERQRYLANPDMYNPGAIISKPLVPKEFEQILAVEFQYVNIEATELRLNKIKPHQLFFVKDNI